MHVAGITCHDLFASVYIFYVIMIVWSGEFDFFFFHFCSIHCQPLLENDLSPHEGTNPFQGFKHFTVINVYGDSLSSFVILPGKTVLNV